MNWEAIAEMAYEAFVESHAEEGCEIEETWEQLEQMERNAWIATVKVAVDVHARAVTA
ncbi:MAG TPA: hypothetical protein VJS44_08240 [Pyrinomonadaceae bacterium]|nr:hypothetical protein [Pyrinomonadaceae bacterium]